MKILLTGCSAAQSSPESNNRVPTFAGFLNFCFTKYDYEVVWQNPSVKVSKEYLSQFDSVCVGVSSPLSPTSHRGYGALATINLAYELGNLSLFVDSPEPSKVWSGIRAIYNNPKTLVKPFHSTRNEYSLINSDEKMFNKVIGGIEKLVNNQWPNTFIPGYSWSDKGSVPNYLPNIDSANVYMLNPDSLLVDTPKFETTKTDEDFWCVDNTTTPWFEKTSKVLDKEYKSYKSNNYSTQEEIYERLSKSIGAIVSVYKDNKSWWLPSTLQALHVGVPVATEWRNTAHMGQEWSYTVTNIEEMSPAERYDVANKQYVSYRNNLPDWEAMCVSVANAIENKKYAKK